MSELDYLLMKTYFCRDNTDRFFVFCY